MTSVDECVWNKSTNDRNDNTDVDDTKTIKLFSVMFEILIDLSFRDQIEIRFACDSIEAENDDFDKFWKI